MSQVCAHTENSWAIKIHDFIKDNKSFVFLDLLPNYALEWRSGQVQSGRTRKLEVVPMTESSSTLLEKTCVAWSSRREREISLRVSYSVQEQDGCKIYTLGQVQVLEY